MARPEIRIVCDDKARHRHGRAVVIRTYERHGRTAHGRENQWLQVQSNHGTLLTGDSPLATEVPLSFAAIINDLTPHVGEHRGKDTWFCEECPEPKSKVEITDIEMFKALDHALESGIPVVPLRIIELGITGR